MCKCRVHCGLLREELDTAMGVSEIGVYHGPWSITWYTSTNGHFHWETDDYSLDLGVYRGCTPISDERALRLFDGYFILGILCSLDFEYLRCDGPVKQSRGGSDSYLGGNLLAFPVWLFHTHYSSFFACNIYICVYIYVYSCIYCIYIYTCIHIHLIHAMTYDTYIYTH